MFSTENQQLGVEAINPNDQNANGESPKDNNCASLLQAFPVNAGGYTVNDTDSYFDKKFPPGYRFKPYDSELLVHYLWKKIKNEPLPPNGIQEVKLYDFNPWKLAEKYKPLDENEWYFFTPRERKYPHGQRPNRAAAGGYWKATGADKPVEFDDVVVGLKKALVFYIGKPPDGKKTGWIMHEFKAKTPSRIRKHANDTWLDDWVLCRMYKKRKAQDRSRRASTGDQDDSFHGDQQTETELQNAAAIEMAAETFLCQGTGLLDMSGFGNQGRYFNTYDNVFMYPQSTFQNHIGRLPETIPQYSHHNPGPGQNSAWLSGQNSSWIPQTYPLASNQNLTDNLTATARPTSTFQLMEKLEQFDEYNSVHYLEDGYFDDPLHHHCRNSDFG